MVTQNLGLGQPLSEVGTGFEQKRTCYSPHHLIIWSCLPGTETETTTTIHYFPYIFGKYYLGHREAVLIDILFGSLFLLYLFQFLHLKFSLLHLLIPFISVWICCSIQSKIFQYIHLHLPI